MGPDLEGRPHEAFVEYVAYLSRDADERPLAALIDDVPTYAWLETALASDHAPLPPEAADGLAYVVGEDVEGATWAEAGARLAAYCRQVLRDFDR